MKTVINRPLTKTEIAAFEKEIEEIRKDVLSKVGEEDSNYIRDIEKS